MEQQTRELAAPPSRLQSDLLPRILGLIAADHLAAGARLPELAFARRLQVSRTPVRAALLHLAARGITRQVPRGFILANPEAAKHLAGELAAGPGDEATRLALRLAGARHASELPAEISEADLMRRYAVGRATMQRALSQLAELGVIERKPGHGWAFLPALYDPAVRAESHRWRMLIEPALFLQPGFALDHGWVAAMQARHEDAMTAPWRETASIAFFEMNAAFHEGLAAGAGNRHLLLAVQQQTRLRRLANYNWGYAREHDAVAHRVAESCREHLEILDRATAGDCEVAAALMRRHIERASRLVD